MKFFDVPLSSWAPAANGHLYRPGPRPAFDRDVNYEDRFDYTTIIYDAFWSQDGREILLICPPPQSLTSDVFGGEIYEVPSGRRCKFEVVQSASTHILHIPVSKSTQSLELVFPLASYSIVPQPNLCSKFAGERVLLTHNKNNSLRWIRDWAHFHAEMHGCTAVFFYDNGSYRYAKYDVRAALATVPGLKCAALVDAPFPFGAVNGPLRVNDSRFFQRAYLAHAKYRLYGRAASVVHIDIDELIISPSGESFFEAVEKSRTGCVTIEGVWVERATEEGIEPPIREIGHATFHHVAKGGGRPTGVKSGIAPARVDDRAFLVTHAVLNAQSDFETASRFKHRHFMGLKTVETNVNNVHRLVAMPFETVDPTKHEPDGVLMGQLSKVFDAEKYRQMPAIEPFATGHDGETCRRFAGRSFARGDYEGAIEWTREAITLAPGYPTYHEYLARCLDRAGRPEEAAAARRRAEELWATNPQHQLSELRKRHKLGDSEGADAAMPGIAAQFPDSADAQDKYGNLLAKRGDRVGAEAAFRKAVELAPTDPRKLLRLARHLNRNGGGDEVIELLRRTIALERIDPAMRAKAYTRLARTLEDAGRLEEARATVRDALAAVNSVGKITMATREELQAIATRIGEEPSRTAATLGADSVRRESAQVWQRLTTPVSSAWRALRPRR